MTTREDLHPQQWIGAMRCSIAASISATAPMTQAATPTRPRQWVDAQRFARLIVVTSSYHMPRSLDRARPRHAPGRARFPIRWCRAPSAPSAGGCTPRSIRVLFTEYLKFLPSAARFGVARLLGNGTASALAGGTSRRPQHLTRQLACSMLRSLLFLAVFYVNTAVFLLCGSWLLLAPRRWAMQGLRLHGLASLWWLKLICGTKLEVRGREKLPQGACLVAAKHQVGLGYLRPDPGVPRSRHGDEGGAGAGSRSTAGSATSSGISSSSATKARARSRAMIRDARDRARLAARS